MRIRTDMYDVLLDSVRNGIEDDGKFSDALEDALRVLDLICKYCDRHGEISLTCGSEWMYQNDNAQIDALELVGDILDELEDYGDYSEND